jgi:hypothetical protein
MVFPIVAPPNAWEPWSEQFWLHIISESFHVNEMAKIINMKILVILVNMTYSGSTVLEKKIFKWLHPIFAFLKSISPLKRAWPFI